MPRNPRRRIALVLGTFALGAAALVGCGAASDAAGDTMLDLAEGSWSCRASDDDRIELRVDPDGAFSVAGQSDEDDETETEAGSWKVVEQDVRISLAGSIGRVVDGKGLGVDAGSLTLEVPSMERKAEEGDTELQTFDVAVEGKDTVEISPSGDTERRYPSGSITCTRG